MGKEATNGTLTWVSRRFEHCPHCTSVFPAYEAVRKDHLKCPCCKRQIGLLPQGDRVLIAPVEDGLDELKGLIQRLLVAFDKQGSTGMVLHAERYQWDTRRLRARRERKEQQILEAQPKRNAIGTKPNQRAFERDWNQALQEDKYRSMVLARGPAKSYKTYVIQDTYSSMAKIGITRGTVEERLDGLQLGCPSELVICAVFDGNVERMLHTMFSAWSIGREWFVPCWEMVQYINKNAQDNRRQVVIPSAGQVEAFNGRMVAHGR